MRGVLAAVLGGALAAEVLAWLAVWHLTGSRPWGLVGVSLLWAVGCIVWLANSPRRPLGHAAASAVAVGAVGGLVAAAWLGWAL